MSDNEDDIKPFTPASTGDGFYDGEGKLRSPGESYTDAAGVWRSPGESFTDASGSFKSAGESFTDGNGTFRNSSDFFGSPKKGNDASSDNNDYDYEGSDVEEKPKTYYSSGEDTLIDKVFDFVGKIFTKRKKSESTPQTSTNIEPKPAQPPEEYWYSELGFKINKNMPIKEIFELLSKNWGKIYDTYGITKDIFPEIEKEAKDEMRNTNNDPVDCYEYLLKGYLLLGRQLSSTEPTKDDYYVKDGKVPTDKIWYYTKLIFDRDYITVENLGTETLKNLGAMIPISVFDLIKEKALKSDNPEFSYNEMLVKEMHKMNVKLCKQIMWVQIPKQRINEMFSEAWKMKGDPIRSYEYLYQKEFSKYKGMENKENYNRETR